MNIFVTDECPYQSAVNLDSKRVVKMVLESAQLLSNACHHILGEGPYRKTHWNHPCSIIVRENPLALDWLFFHFKALCLEYTHRYRKVHKCVEHMEIFKKVYNKSQGSLPEENLRQLSDTMFVNCCTNHKHIEDVILAYRMEMCHKWNLDKRDPVWHDRGTPSWVTLEGKKYAVSNYRKPEDIRTTF